MGIITDGHSSVLHLEHFFNFSAHLLLQLTRPHFKRILITYHLLWWANKVIYSYITISSNILPNSKLALITVIPLSVFYTYDL